MKKVRLRPRARADLAEIRRYTRRLWGAAQARAYLEELGARIDSIAAGHTPATTLSVRGRPFGRCRHKEHYIFFRETGEIVEVVRVFHVKMDVVQRLLDE